MVLKLFLLLFAVQSVQLAPAKHTYQAFKLPRNQRQTPGSNGFNTAGFGQTAFGGQQDNSQLVSGTTSSPLGSFTSTGFGQSQNQGAFQSALGQGQNLGFGQTNGFGSATGFAQNQNLGLGLNSQAPNSGLGQLTAEQAYAQIDAELAQIQAAGLGATPNQGLGANLNQGFGSNLNQAFGANLNQGLGANLNQGLGANLNQGFGANLNQGLGSNLNQGFGQGFGQDSSALNPGLAQGFPQNLPQGQDLNQGFNQQLGSNLQQFGSAGNSQQYPGATPAQPPLNPQIFTPASPDSESSFGGANDDQQKPIEIGGKPNKNFNNIPQPQQNGYDNEGPIVTKDFYLHSAPDDFGGDIDLEKVKLGPSRKHYNVVFIKAPSLSPKSAALQLIQANNEEKTVIYVLNKQLDPAEIRANIKQLPNNVNKPEVFFIKYRTPEEAAFAQQKIQAQFDALGGTSRVSDEGISPLSSVVGALDAQNQAQFEALQQQIQQAKQQQEQPLPQNGQQQQFQQEIQQQLPQQQPGPSFANGGPQKLPNGGDISFDQGQQFQQGLNEGTDSPFNSGEGIIEPRIGPGKPIELDGEAIGKTQNFGAAGQVDSRLTRRLQPRKSKPRH